MIGLFLLLSAASAPDASPPNCLRAAGSEIVLCGTPPPQSAEAPPPPQGGYRLPRLAPKRYGPALPSAQSDLGHGVRAKLRGQSSNSGRGRRNGSVATLSVPF